MTTHWTARAILGMILTGIFRIAAADCEEGHWIESVSDDGEIIVLEDGSVWQIDAMDTSTTTLWTDSTEIVACDDKLINADDKEIVQATRIK